MSNKQSKYEYDSMGRLVAVSLRNGAQASYGYDLNGNRTTVVEVPATLTLDEPASVVGIPKRHCGDFEENPMVVLLSSGKLVAWGDSTNGSLANNSFESSNAAIQETLFDPNSPVPPTDSTVLDYALTNANLYVVFSNGWAYSSGKNAYGQLGHGDTIQRGSLKRIDSFVNNGISISKVWAAGVVDATDGGGCAYFQSADRKMYACGENSSGNLGTGTTSNTLTPSLCVGLGSSPDSVTDVLCTGARDRFSTYMLISNGEVKVAGFNGQGQLGTGNTTNVTSGFVSATKTGPLNLSAIVSISATAGFQGATRSGCALVVDSAGRVWTTGENGVGQLGLGDTTNRNRFTQVSTLANIVKAEVGGGHAAYGYAINSAGSMFTWGYNARNNLFKNSTASPVTTPSLATFLPGIVSKVFFPREQALGLNNAQLIVVTTSGRIAYAGEDLGQQSVSSAVNPGAYKLIPMPRRIVDGSESIVQIFVHGSGVAQRWFLLTDHGTLYASGNNADSICVGGLSSDAKPITTTWYKLDFHSMS